MKTTVTYTADSLMPAFAAMKSTADPGCAVCQMMKELNLLVELLNEKPPAFSMDLSNELDWDFARAEEDEGADYAVQGVADDLDEVDAVINEVEAALRDDAPALRYEDVSPDPDKGDLELDVDGFLGKPAANEDKPPLAPPDDRPAIVRTAARARGDLTRKEREMVEFCLRLQAEGESITAHAVMEGLNLFSSHARLYLTRLREKGWLDRAYFGKIYSYRVLRDLDGAALSPPPLRDPREKTEASPVPQEALNRHAAQAQKSADAAIKKRDPSGLNPADVETLKACINVDSSGGAVTVSRVASRRNMILANIYYQINHLQELGYLRLEMMERAEAGITSGKLGKKIIILKNLDGSKYKKPAAETIIRDGVKITQCPPAYAAGFGLSKPQFDYK